MRCDSNVEGLPQSRNNTIKALNLNWQMSSCSLLDVSLSGSCYSELDNLTANPENAQAQDNSKGNRRRRSLNSYPKQIVRSLSSTIARVQSNKDSPPASTTSAQLRAATVRGEISASEEQVNIARAQRERNALRYHADEAVKAGNAAAVKSNDIAYWIEHDSSSSSTTGGTMFTPPSQKIKMAAEGSRQRLAVLDSVHIINVNQIGNANGSKKKMPWEAMQSMRSSFPARMSSRKQDADKDEKEGSGLEEKVVQMKELVLKESHNQSGALLLLDPTTIAVSEPALLPKDQEGEPRERLDCKARARVKLIIENPDQAVAYIRLGLHNNPDMDVTQMIQMIDYYCT